jgi:ribonuclease BN (tRNA processing enzyme)
MRVTFLGTGNAFASGGRNAMAILLRSDDFGVLLDCGPTTLVALKKLGLSPSAIDVILLSHHHGDHFGGVPFIVLHECYEAPWRRPLSVAGPDGTETKLSETMRSFFPGIDPAPFSLAYRDLAAGELFTERNVRATPFEVDHYSSGTAFGYRVEFGGKTIVFSGDTAWIGELAGHSAGADLFICECSSFDAPLSKHISHRDLVDHRTQIAAKRTLLVHAGDDVLTHEHELVFELAHDGMEVEL